MVQVRISETYDLSTVVNKMGVIGIHTPSPSQLKRVWGNLMKAHNHFRFVSCDVTVACASMLPADPLQIGTEAGSIAPQDMFNPILYTAVSNDSFNRITGRIYNAPDIKNGSSVSSNTIDSSAFDVYYSLLAEPDKWKKAMPQSGLQMKGLYPIVYQVVNTFGNLVDPVTHKVVTDPEYDGPTQTDLDMIGVPDTSGDPFADVTVASNKAFTFRGPSMRMPAIPTEIVQCWDEDGTVTASLTEPDIAPTYVACIVTPPAKLNRLYYRMKVTWTIEFTGLRSDLESASLSGLATVGMNYYTTDYDSQSKNMDKLESSVDVKDADIEMVMTASR